jgi:beta-glucosidase
MTEVNRPWNDRSLPPEEGACLLVAAMTEDEKFSWLSGQSPSR